MVREGIETKGRRYLTEGRLVVEFVHGREVRAQCRGDGSRYHLGHDDQEDHVGWWCSCPARGRCAHLVALGLVTAIGGRP